MRVIVHYTQASPKKKNKSNISEAALAASYHGSIVQSRRPVEPSETKKTSALTLERRLAQQLKSTGNLSDLKARGLD